MRILSFSLFLALSMQVSAQTFCDDLTQIPSNSTSSSTAFQLGDIVSLTNAYSTIELASENTSSGSYNSMYFLSNLGSLYGISGNCMLKISPNYSLEEIAVYASNFGAEYGDIPSFIINGDSSSNQLEFHTIDDFPMTVGGVDVSLDTTYIADGVTNSAYKMNFIGDVSTGLLIRSSIDITFREICLESAFLSTNEVTSPNSTIIFPNPTQGHIYLESSKETQIESVLVFDILGNVLQTYTPNSTQYNLSLNGPKGIYIIKVNKEGNLSELLKVVKH